MAGFTSISTATWLWAALAAGLTIVVAYVVAEVAARLIRTMFLAVSEGDGSTRFGDPIIRRPVWIARAVVFAGTLAVLALPALELVGLRAPRDGRGLMLLTNVYSSGLRLLVVTLLTYVMVRVVALMAARLEAYINDEKSSGGVQDVERAKRAHTVGRLARNAVTTLILAVAGLMILRELGLDIMPVLTGAGILGLAVGFGAQTLVRDVISGFFLIVENNLRVGDVVVIDGTGGIVEAINLRTTVMRDLEGTLHVLPNGSFERFSNRTKDFSYYVIDVGVAYKEDTDRVSEVLRAVGAELLNDPAFSSSILAPLEVLGVDAFEDSQVTIKVRIKTVPLKQWEVGRELRRRIKKAFDQGGIEIPFPHMSVYFGEASRPWRFETTEAGRHFSEPGHLTGAGSGGVS